MDISKIVLGGGRFGSITSKRESFEIMERYMSLGGRTFDTARVYGTDGASEKVIGEFVSVNCVRKDVVIVTKGAHHALDDERRTPRLSCSEIKSDLHRSLDALKSDYVDVYLLHRDDPRRDVGEIVEVMHGLVRSGLVKCVGVSNWKYDRIKKANEYAKTHSLTPFTFNQVEFGRAVINADYIPDPTLERLSADEYAKNAACDPGVKLMAYSSQCNGFFYKVFKYGVDGLPQEMKAKFLNPDTLYNLELISAVAKDLGITAASVALSSVVNDKLNISAVAGANSTAQLEEIMSALTIDSSLMRELSERLRK